MPRTIKSHETYIGADQSERANLARAFHIIDADTRVKATAAGGYVLDPSGGYLAVSGVRQLLKADARDLNALSLSDFLAPTYNKEPELPGVLVVVREDQLGPTEGEWVAERKRQKDEERAARDEKDAERARADAAIDEHRSIARGLAALGINADSIDTGKRQVTLSFDEVNSLIAAAS